MADTVDDSKNITILLTGEDTEPTTEFPWMLLAAAAGGLYLLLDGE